MSGAEDREALAAECALGCLEGADAAEADRLLREDPRFAAAVAAWQLRLAPLARAAPAASPPANLFGRIAHSAGIAAPAGAEIVPIGPARRRRDWFWPAATGASLALAAALAAFILLRPAPPDAIAVLTPQPGAVAAAGPVLVALHAAGGTTVRPAGSLTVPAGRDLELWSLPPGAARPQSLGVMPAAGRNVAAPLANGTQLMVSLEPAGGSTTGLPTGPVIYAGTLAAIR